MENKYLPEVEIKNLPSKKLQYPEATRIYYKPFTLGDLQKINNSNMDAIQLYEYILEGIRVSGMEKSDLTFYDTVYIGWLRKIASLGTPLFNMKAYCPQCDTMNSRTIELKDMEFEDTKVPSMPINIKIRDINLVFKYLTIRDYIDILRLDKMSDVVHVFAKHVSNLPFEEAYNLIFSLIGSEVDNVEYINGLLYHGLSKVPFKCHECKLEYMVNPANYTEAEITRPFRRQEDDIRNEISFG